MTSRYANDANNPSVTPTTAHSLADEDIEKESTIGEKTGDKSNEEIVLPNNRLFIVFMGLVLSVFLAALDQTIVGKYFYLRGVC